MSADIKLARIKSTYGDVVDDAGRDSHAGHSHLHMKHYIPRPGHEDHELRHSLIILLLFVLIGAAQVGLVTWKKRSYATYMQTTLVCLWTFPPVLMIMANGFTTSIVIFLTVWALFSAVHAYIWTLCKQKPLLLTTPRIVYSLFYNVYRLCFGSASLGYIIFMINIFFFHHLKAIGVLFIGRVGFMMILYGMYFGLIGRDFAELVSVLIASGMGYASKEDMPTTRKWGTEELSQTSSSVPGHSQACGVCQGVMRSSRLTEVNLDHLRGSQRGGEDESKKDGSTNIVKSVLEKANSLQEKSPYKLPCGHRFHESCIRGWAVVGKKDTCPMCAEKVELGTLFEPNVWAKKSILWAQLLDALRYLIVWNPVVVLVMQVMIYILD